jgi:hypothetical protein
MWRLDRTHDLLRHYSPARQDTLFINALLGVDLFIRVSCPASTGYNKKTALQASLQAVFIIVSGE